MYCDILKPTCKRQTLNKIGLLQQRLTRLSGAQNHFVQVTRWSHEHGRSASASRRKSPFCRRSLSRPAQPDSCVCNARTALGEQRLQYYGPPWPYSASLQTRRPPHLALPSRQRDHWYGRHGNGLLVEDYRHLQTLSLPHMESGALVIPTDN